MKRLKISIAGMLLLGLASASAFAQPTFSVGSASGPEGSGTPLVVNMNWESDGVVVVADLRVTYDSANLSVTEDCSGNSQWQCNDNGSGTITVLGFDGNNVLNSGLVGTLTFDISSAAVGDYPLPVVVVEYGNAAAQLVTPDQQPEDNGEISVLGAAADFTPNAGLLDLGSVQQGGTDPTANITIDNTGATGTTLTGTCSESGDTNNAFTVTGDTSFSVPEAGPNDQVTVSCDANLAPATYNATLSCTHNGDTTGESSPAVFNLSCTVTPGPAPAYSSNPIPGSTLDFGTVPKGDPDPQQIVSISNSGDTGTTLTGTCSISSNPNGAYSIVGTNAFSVDEGAAADDITVACDTDVTGNHAGGQLSCTHNGSNASPATYGLACNIPPEPAFDGQFDEPPQLGPVPQNNTDPTGTLTITNTGDQGSTLSGSCTMTETDGGVITIQSGGGGYSVDEGAPGQDVIFVCDSSAQPGVYSGTLSCTHNADNAANPFVSGISCEIGQPDSAQYGSTPIPGSTLNFNAGGSVVVGDPDPTLPLEIRNDAMQGDADMNVSCTLTDVVGSAITAAPDITNEVVAPGGSLNVTFTCDTETASPDGTPYEASYECDWSSVFVPEREEPATDGPQSNIVNYTATCEVIDAESEVEPETPSGTTHTELVEPGGSATYSFTFNEIQDQGADGEIDCSLDDGSAGFTIQSPASFPATVPSGGSTTVVVEGTDPGGVESTTDTLRCTYTDTMNPEGVEVFYDLVLLIGGNATFMVTKDFTDDNPGEVWVTLSCNTGLPLEQSKLISEAEYVKFIVGDFDSGELDCTVTESVPAGYSASYDATGSASTFVDDDPDNPGCHFIDVDGGDDNFCAITNSPDPVDVVINKEFVFEGNSMDAGIDTEYRLTLWCDAEIVGGVFIGDNQEAPANHLDGCGLIKVQSAAQGIVELPNWCKNFWGTSSEQFIAQVIPEYPDSDCYVIERVFDDAVETDNGCTDITVSAGQGDECTITNTVFFEGIPTLSQYGMAILALLMLGIGLVGFRRFA